MRDALSLLDQAIAFANGIITDVIVKQMLGISDDGYLFELIDAISSTNSQKLVATAQTIYKEGRDLENILHGLSQKFCDLSLTQLAKISFDEKTNEFAGKMSVNDIQLCFEITNLGLEQIAKVNEKYPVFIMTLLRMVAFHIGSTETKQVIIGQNNFNVEIDNVTLTQNPVIKTALLSLPAPVFYRVLPANYPHQEVLIYFRNFLQVR